MTEPMGMIPGLRLARRAMPAKLFERISPLKRREEEIEPMPPPRAAVRVRITSETHVQIETPDED